MKTSDKTLWPVVAVLLACAVPGQAAAEAPLTLLPWNGAFFQADKEEKSRLVLSYSQSFDSTVVDVKLSSRLDGSGTRADFLQGGGLAPGFQASVLVGHDSNLATLYDMLGAAFSYKTDLCREWLKQQMETDQPAEPCNTDKYKEWEQKRLQEEVKELGGDKQVRDALRERLVPGEKSRLTYFIGGEAAVSYDQVTALIGDLTSDSAPFSQLSVTAGARFTLYATSYLAATVRAGYEYSDDASYFEAERCVSLPSGEPSVTGTTCRKVKVLALDSPPAHSGYAEVAATVLIPKEVSNATPGVEVRARLEGIGQSRTLLIRPTFFIAPTTEPLTAKFGVGVEVSRELDAGPGGAPGQWQFTPFAVIGANLL